MRFYCRLRHMVEFKRAQIKVNSPRLVYLVSSGNLNETLTHRILPGLLKTKPFSANKQKNELLCGDSIIGAAERSTDLVHLYQLSVSPGPLDSHLHNIGRRRHVCVLKALCKNK